MDRRVGRGYSGKARVLSGKACQSWAERSSRMSEKRGRKHHKKGPHARPSFFRKYWFEISVSTLFVLGVFLLAERVQIKATIYAGFLRSGADLWRFRDVGYRRNGVDPDRFGNACPPDASPSHRKPSGPAGRLPAVWRQPGADSVRPAAPHLGRFASGAHEALLLPQLRVPRLRVDPQERTQVAEGKRLSSRRRASAEPRKPAFLWRFGRGNT